MNIVFWNTAGKSANAAIAALAEEKRPDLLILAEYKSDATSLLRSLRSNGADYKIVPQIACDKLTLVTTYPTSIIKHRRDGDRYSIKEIHLHNAEPLLLVMVHLPSKLRMTEDDQATRATLVREDIEATEQECMHRNTVVIGDFNMNPFEKGMISALAFNSIPCVRANLKESRKIGGKEFMFFYNPSWNLLGDRNASAGTFFHRNPGTLSHYWNTLDQAILRPSIAKALNQETPKIITKSGGVDFINDDSTPSESDHLPIHLELNIEREKSMKNLWPEFSESKESSPKQTLDEQASLLTKITSGMVSAEVGVISSATARNAFETENPFNFEFTIVGPFIDNYKHRIIRISHGIPMYPVLVLIEGAIGKELGLQTGPYGARAIVDSAEEFDTLFSSVVQTERIKSIVGTILTLSR